MVMLRLWLNNEGNRATGSVLERALRKCDRKDIVNKCIFNTETDIEVSEQETAKTPTTPDQVQTQQMFSAKKQSRAKTVYFYFRLSLIPSKKNWGLLGNLLYRGKKPSKTIRMMKMK